MNYTECGNSSCISHILRKFLKRGNFSYSNLTKFAQFNYNSTETSGLFDPPFYLVVTLFSMYGAICLAAFFGNLIVIWLIMGSRRMWTVTNIFICNLAIADLIMAVFIIPFHFQAALFQTWYFPNVLCSFGPFAQVLSVTVSVMTLSAIALHREMGIMKPFKIRLSKREAILILIIMWIVSGVIAIPTGYDYSVQKYWRGGRKMTWYCHNTNLPNLFRTIYNCLLVIVQYVMPFLIITSAYYRIGKKICKQNASDNENKNKPNEEVLLRNKRIVTKMFAVVVTMFGVCWLPLQTYNFLQTIIPRINDFPYINIVWFSIHWLAMSNSCCNPFIYGIYNKSFRQEFKRRIRYIFSGAVRLTYDFRCG